MGERSFMKHIALVTARGGVQSIKNKNLTLINKMPIVAYSINAALESVLISEVFVSSEDVRIQSVAKQFGAKIIDRPAYLSLPDADHGEVIKHAFEEIKKIFGSFDTLTVLLGNTVMNTGHEIDESLQHLLDNNDCTSLMTVQAAVVDHPFKALTINKYGYLEPFLKTVSVSPNRQSYPPVFFYDSGPWIIKFSTLEEPSIKVGVLGPYWWMGQKCLSVPREWITGKDIHTSLDIKFSKWWINHNTIK